jgi:hypothetical protein
MIGFCLVVFVVIVVFETQNELARQARQDGGSSGASLGDPSSAGERPAAEAETEPLGRRVRAYYRAHDLPHGWVFAGLIERGAAAVTVRITFSPTPQDRRYGQAAPAEDVLHGSFCPTPAEFWRGAGSAAITVELGDKTGVIRAIDCRAPD